MRSSKPLAALALAALSGSAALAGAPQYTLRDLGAIGSDVSQAFAISPDGAYITGTAILNGAFHAYALMPVTAVPEPGSPALMLAGLAVLGGIARRRKR